MVSDEQIQNALKLLKTYILELTETAGCDEEYGNKLWQGIVHSKGLLKELSYYYDNGSFLCEYKIAGYTLADILVWQVDHFKLYMDRSDDMNRYKPEKLLLSAFETMLEMEKDAEPVIKKLKHESGQDQANN